ncbi:gamma-glutamyltransferase [Chitinophaga alhagiae]|uniref:gamma-glutamyltransferase n=1 Tax=Chitinophaga alhagiae TaxID=2203219 RepID=UPI000E5A8CD7|nr:gamma-glutamyltransferase [Chitinophaga alhagiae]
MRFPLISVLLLYTGAALAQSSPYNYQVTKYMTPRRYAVVSAHPLASEAGAQVMKAGGNAVDAAIATQLALAVVYPEAGNLGGGGFMVARLRNGQSLAIDYREMAPQKAHRDMYLDGNGNAQTRLSLDGHLAAGVPGTVAGLFASHQYAKLPFAKLVAPAIKLAEKGFVITEREAAGLNRRKEDFIRLNTMPTAFVKDTPWKAGDTLVQKDLARTLRLIAQKGAAGFYEGETAEKVVAEMRRGGGIISAADLKGYRAKPRQPLQFKFRGYDILTMPLPSSGGVGIQQMLGMVESYPLEEWGFHSVQSVQVMIEAERRAYADRAKFLGDPDFTSPPLAAITQPSYLKTRMQTFTPGRATPSEAVQAGLVKESMQTTHLSVLDADGNAVSVTTTLNGGYGSKVVVGGAGFLLNNEMDDFSVKPGTPNMYGLIGAEANAIAPRKRMLSSMTPTIVLQHNRPVLIAGTPGGSTIITSVFQTILNALVFNLDAQTTVNAPKFHHQWLPDEVRIEQDFPDSTRAALEKMGYKFVKSGPWSRTEVIKIHPDGKIEAVGDKRGDDSAAGE